MCRGGVAGQRSIPSRQPGTVLAAHSAVATMEPTMTTISGSLPSPTWAAGLPLRPTQPVRVFREGDTIPPLDPSSDVVTVTLGKDEKYEPATPAQQAQMAAETAGGLVASLETPVNIYNSVKRINDPGFVREMRENRPDLPDWYFSKMSEIASSLRDGIQKTLNILQSGNEVSGEILRQDETGAYRFGDFKISQRTQNYVFQIDLSGKVESLALDPALGSWRECSGVVNTRFQKPAAPADFLIDDLLRIGRTVCLEA